MSLEYAPAPRRWSFASLTVVIPAYNEERRLPAALDELFEEVTRLRSYGLTVDVLVVDDGSSDGTVAAVSARAEAATGLLHVLCPGHAGKGGAVRTGMLVASGEVVLFSDADMATPAREIERVLDAMETCDVVLGSRIDAQGHDKRASQTRMRRLFGWAYHVLASTLVTGGINDTQCGFKAFRRTTAQIIFARQILTSVVFDAEIIYLARQLGARIVVLPVEWEDKRGSRMRATVQEALRVFADLVRIRIVHRRESLA